MSDTPPPSGPTVPPVRQEVVDELVHHLGTDDQTGFADAERRLDPSRAEVAAASAGLIETRELDLSALEHTLEVLEDVVGLPEPDEPSA